MLTIFRSMIISSLRDKITVFYSLLFPLAVMIGLGIYMDNMDERILTGVTAIGTIFWGMQGIAFQVLYQRNKGVYKMLKITPFPIAHFIISMVLARTVLGVGLNMVVWTFGVLLFQISLSFSMIGGTLLLVTVATLCFTSLGFFIANLANNEGHINMIANLFQIPFILFSEAFYSLSSTPGWIQFLSKLSPFEHYVKGLNGVMEGAVLNLGSALLMLLFFMLISFLLAIATFKWEEKIKTEYKVFSN